MSQHLKTLTEVPSALLSIPPRSLTQVIDAPTLIHLSGEHHAPLLVSIIVHGNEFSGLIAMQKILQRYHKKPLPRDLIIFIGNPQACAQGVRQLPTQLDFNRIWKGGDHPEHHMAQEVLQYMKEQKVYAAVDIHNNTGKNPIYACINRRREEFIRLAQLFSSKIVFFTQPDSIFSLAASKLCPTATIECGLPGTPAGIASGVKLIEALLERKERWRESHLQAKSIYHTFARLKIKPGSSLSVDSLDSKDSSGHHLCLADHFDEFNFKELKAGTILGQIKTPSPVEIIGEDGRDIFHQLCSIEKGSWVVKEPFIASMFTKHIPIAKSDCLGYAMGKEKMKDFLAPAKNHEKVLPYQ